MSQTISERREYRRKANGNRPWINDDLSRLLYRADLYILAYERIISKPGNMTGGTDGETSDGFSMEAIQTIIQETRMEQIYFKPVRTTFIAKTNGKMRKLGILRGPSYGLSFQEMFGTPMVASAGKPDVPVHPSGSPLPRAAAGFLFDTASNGTGSACDTP
jgi:hypothetical protein